MSFAAGAGVSDTDGFSGGRLAACLVSGFGAVVFGADASGRGGSGRDARPPPRRRRGEAGAEPGVSLVVEPQRRVEDGDGEEPAADR